jgi:membrane protease YdiL (CAAX protease family)
MRSRLAERVPARLALIVVAAAWLGLTHAIVPLGTALIPDALKPRITYPQFLAGCQIVTVAVGAALAWALLRDPRRALGLSRPRPVALVTTSLLAPLTFVVASATALRVALPYLLEELARRGPGVAREAAGAMGQRLEQAPLLFTLVWGAVLAAISEELLFRGALYSAFERLVPEAKPRPAIDPDADDAIVDFARPSPFAIAVRGALPAALATIGSAAIFGLLHWDMEGAVGIVHVVSTACLGLACGTARALTRGITAPVVLHFLYNVIVIGNARRWFGVSEEPIVSGLPNAAIHLAAGASLVALTLVMIARRTGGSRAASADVALGA